MDWPNYDVATEHYIQQPKHSRCRRRKGIAFAKVIPYEVVANGVAHRSVVEVRTCTQVAVYCCCGDDRQQQRDTKSGRDGLITKLLLEMMFLFAAKTFIDRLPDFG